MLSHRKKKPRVGDQKQGLPGAGREVFGGGDVKFNLQNPKPQTPTKKVGSPPQKAFCARGG
jgi:hypothetical protein